MMYKKQPCAKYDKEGNIIAVADSMTELAEMLGVTIGAVSRGIKKGMSYFQIEDDDKN